MKKEKKHLKIKLIPIQVECKADKTPRRFFREEQSVEVKEVLGSWFKAQDELYIPAENGSTLVMENLGRFFVLAACFKVRGADGHEYLLKHNLASDEWFEQQESEMNHKNPSPSPSITYRHKAYWEPIREQFTWHLRPPFAEGSNGKRRFDCTHWWDKSPDEITPAAALYELARRHPDVGRALKEGDCDKKEQSQQSYRLGFLCQHGLSNWKTLAASVVGGSPQTEVWEFFIGKLKGLDFRDETSLFRCVTEDALTTLYSRDRILGEPFPFRTVENETAPSRKSSVEEFHSFISDLKSLIGPSFEERFREAIKKDAILYHNRGMLLFACAPDVTKDRAIELFNKRFMSGRWHATQKRRPQRERKKTKTARGKPLEQKTSIDEVQGWLKTISAFEDDFQKKRVIDHNLYTDYCRIFDGVRLTDKVRIDQVSPV